jgi:geranylgeranyl pyrophosphate synthase
MSANQKLTDIRKAFKKRGGPAMKIARKTLLKFKDDTVLSQALRYFSKVTLHNALPVFPALIAMSCEAVAGDIKKTTPYGEAIVLISAAADLHDDVIDRSLKKANKLTVLGKFNAETALLAGDVLLVKGIRLLSEAAEAIPKKQGQEILKLVSNSVFEICQAESMEIQMHDNKFSLTPDEYLEVIKLKAVVPELAMKIGAIVGDGSSDEVERLGQFGRIYGINSILFEEFADLLNIDELKNRLEHECPPLPLLYALENPQIKASIMPLLKPESINESIHKKIVNTTLESKEELALQKILVLNANREVKKLEAITGKIKEELADLLLVPLKFIEA